MANDEMFRGRQVRTPREECKHAELQFGSGDYYIFCHACGAWWATVDPASKEYRPAPELANKGEGSQLSGKVRRDPLDPDNVHKHSSG